MEEIKAWLNAERDIEEGLRLYRLYGKNEFLKTRFAATRDAYTRQKLVEELQSLLCDTIKLPPEASKPTQPIATPEADQSHYLSLLQKRDDIVKQIERNMALLDYSTSQTILFETAKQILRLHQKKCEIWAQIDFFQTNGSFEQLQDPPPAKEKEVQLLYQAISKAKKRLKKTNCKNAIKTQQLLQKHQVRLQSLITHATD